jgi:shikimate dehydrogenase
VAEGSQLIRLAVFGQPVARSLSPRIHDRFAGQFGLDVEYRAVEATRGTFPALLDEFAARGGRGCNVTVPLKGVAWALATQCSDAALQARAANTLVFCAPSERFADNTDGRGLVNDLETHLKVSLAGSEICVIGAGGAAAGVLGALLEAAPARLVIANRTVKRAEDLAHSHSDLGPVSACALAAVSSNSPFDLVVNATSLGHEGSAPDLSPDWLRTGGLCYDMNYGEAAKPLRNGCEAAGMPYSDGLGMLVAQAALSFELWTGKRPETRSVLSHLRSLNSAAAIR